MNVPPGFAKSIVTDVFWPAWEWGPLGRPSTRYVTFSYSPSLTERDNGRFAKVIQSPLYTSLYGKVVTFYPYALGATKVTNRQTGWKIASSVGGVGTGERGDRVLCLPYGETIATESGPRKIGDIVHGHESVNVWSFNHEFGRFELKPITGWHKNPGRSLVEIETSDGAILTCTANHMVATDAGYWPACGLRVGDALLSASSGMLASSSRVSTGLQGQIEMRPNTAVADTGYSAMADVKFASQRQSSIFVTACYFAHNLFCQMRHAIFEGAVALTIGNVLSPRAIFDIAYAGVTTSAIPMPHFLARRAGADKGRRHELVSESVEGFPVAAQSKTRISLIEGGSHDFPRNSQIEPVAYYDAWHTANTAKTRNQIMGKSDNRQPSFVRVVSVRPLHHVPPHTYCITVADNHNMMAGTKTSIVVSNCDDPHNVKEAESETVRAETIRWFRESITSRLNNPETSATVVIMQRVHEEDVSGVILSEYTGYVHLCIPMEYDPDRNCRTFTDDQDQDIDEPFWEDPRSQEGELAFPERFPAWVVERDSIRMGPSATASQFQQSPSPRGGNIIERDWWQLWPAEGYEPKPGAALEFPPTSLRVGSVDTAYGQKDGNAYNAMTTWGIWHDQRERPKAMLMEAWRGRWPLRGVIPDTAKTEEERKVHWGLLERVLNTVRKRQLDVVLIEDKTRGGDLADELRALLREGECMVVMIQPTGDKVARMNAVQALFADKMIYAPDRIWADMVINEVSQFPKGKFMDLADTTSQVLTWLRHQGVLQMGVEADTDNAQRGVFQGQKVSPYDV